MQPFAPYPCGRCFRAAPRPIQCPATCPRSSTPTTTTRTLRLERALFAPAGVDIVVAQCKTEDDVIAHGKGCRAILLQYAPITARVVAALPDLGIVSRIGAGVRHRRHARRANAAGVWVANSPDYGVGEVATHALALALASIRNIVAYHRDIGARQMALPVVGHARAAVAS